MRTTVNPNDRNSRYIVLNSLPQRSGKKHSQTPPISPLRAEIKRLFICLTQRGNSNGVAHCPSPIIQVFTVVWKLYKISEIIKPLWLRYIIQLGYIDCHCCFFCHCSGEDSIITRDVISVGYKFKGLTYSVVFEKYDTLPYLTRLIPYGKLRKLHQADKIPENGLSHLRF